jgi:glycosyltransferase 2 family protein
MIMLVFQKIKQNKGGKKLTPARLAGLLIAVVIFSFLINRAIQGVQQLLETGVQFTPEYLGISFACQFIGVLLAAAVWSNILRRLGVVSNYLFDLQTFCVSAIARKIPGIVWYAVGRLAIYHTISAPKPLVIIALIIESVVIALGGLVTLGISIQTGLFTSPGLDVRFLLIGIPLIILAVSLLTPLVIRKGVEKARQRNQDTIIPDFIPITFFDTLRWIVAEAGVVILAAGVPYFLMKSIDSTVEVPFFAMLGAVSVSVAIGPFAVWFPGDIGLKDGFIYLALSPWTDSPFAALITLVARLWLSLLEITLGLIFGLALARRIRHPESGELS